MGDNSHIVIVDDDARIRDMLGDYLAEEGFRVTAVGDGEALRRCMADDPPDLVLLDLVLPGEDGLTLIRQIRAGHDIPVVMLSGRGEMVDRVVGLEMGADDYIAKPFHLREVLARVKSVLRRSGAGTRAGGDAPKVPAAGEAVAFDGWRLDMAKRELYSPSGEPVDLTTGEFDLLAAFVENPNRALNRDQLMDIAKSRHWEAYDRSIDTQVGRLRKKIEKDPRNPKLIKTVRGVGYLFAAMVGPA